jgi:hypothetical protein
MLIIENVQSQLMLKKIKFNIQNHDLGRELSTNSIKNKT